MGWVRQLVGVEEAWRGWRLQGASVDCGQTDGHWQCLYNVVGAKPKSEGDLERRVDAAIEALRPLGLEEDGPLEHKTLARGDDAVLILLEGSSQVVTRGTGSVGDGFADWLRTCVESSGLVEQLPWDALTEWRMSADLRVQQWDFTFDRDVAVPTVDGSVWKVDVAAYRKVVVSRGLEPLAAAPECVW